MPAESSPDTWTSILPGAAAAVAALTYMASRYYVRLDERRSRTATEFELARSCYFVMCIDLEHTIPSFIEDDLLAIKAKLSADHTYYPVWTFDDRGQSLIDSLIQNRITSIPGQVCTEIVEYAESARFIIACLTFANSEDFRKFSHDRRFRAIEGLFTDNFNHVRVTARCATALQFWLTEQSRSNLNRQMGLDLHFEPRRLRGLTTKDVKDLTFILNNGATRGFIPAQLRRKDLISKQDEHQSCKPP